MQSGLAFLEGTAPRAGRGQKMAWISSLPPTNIPGWRKEELGGKRRGRVVGGNHR